ncbi:MAG: nickel pincer cofactor biosynthesis protein LarB [Deltaproteobacteria bacterium]|uniref:Nickel pincer cofactor biosynthesis protein LarB n=1 Tax=Candidatus Zymogenus saltonus TaxID=2844893 RepID=A0A9D8KGE0_9DELT|nr:nickel pincer cofactor biosynthesis protein LarB [Candidatus Zymogenus saltonus]
MDRDELKRLLSMVKNGEITVEEGLEELKGLPFMDLGFAMPDTHRAIRQGFPEVVLGEGKRPEDIAEIVRSLSGGTNNVLVTRVDGEKAAVVRKIIPEITHHERARCLVLKVREVEEKGRGTIMVICAGTSDIPVAEEAVLVCELMGNRTERLYDVGVAGIHRLMYRGKDIRSANVLVVVAGMEGALPSVVGGIVERPVVAVPTSIGYGAALGGISALLGMLNSCAAGVCVVNIDNGFSGGYVASLINR